MNPRIPIPFLALLVGCFGGLPDPDCQTTANCPSGTSCQAGKCLPVTVGPPAAVAIAGPAALEVDAAPASYTATVTDAQGNVVDAAAVTWTPSPDAAMEIIPAGQAAGIVGRQVGVIALQASVGGTIVKSMQVTVNPAALDCLPATTTVKQSTRSPSAIYLSSTTLRAKDAAGNVVRFAQAIGWGNGLSESHTGNLGDFNFTGTGGLDGNGGLPLSFDSYATVGTVHTVSLSAYGKTGTLTVTVTQ